MTLKFALLTVNNYLKEIIKCVCNHHEQIKIDYETNTVTADIYGHANSISFIQWSCDYCIKSGVLGDFLSMEIHISDVWQYETSVPLAHVLHEINATAKQWYTWNRRTGSCAIKISTAVRG